MCCTWELWKSDVGASPETMVTLSVMLVHYRCKAKEDQTESKAQLQANNVVNTQMKMLSKNAAMCACSLINLFIASIQPWAHSSTTSPYQIDLRKAVKTTGLAIEAVALLIQHVDISQHQGYLPRCLVLLASRSSRLSTAAGWKRYGPWLAVLNDMEDPSNSRRHFRELGPSTVTPLADRPLRKSTAANLACWLVFSMAAQNPSCCLVSTSQVTHKWRYSYSFFLSCR